MHLTKFKRAKKKKKIVSLVHCDDIDESDYDSVPVPVMGTALKEQMKIMFYKILSNFKY